MVARMAMMTPVAKRLLSLLPLLGRGGSDSMTRVVSAGRCGISQSHSLPASLDTIFCLAGNHKTAGYEAGEMA